MFPVYLGLIVLSISHVSVSELLILDFSNSLLCYFLHGTISLLPCYDFLYNHYLSLFVYAWLDYYVCVFFGSINQSW